MTTRIQEHSSCMRAKMDKTISFRFVKQLHVPNLELRFMQKKNIHIFFNQRYNCFVSNLFLLNYRFKQSSRPAINWPVRGYFVTVVWLYVLLQMSSWLTDALGMSSILDLKTALMTLWMSASKMILTML